MLDEGYQAQGKVRGVGYIWAGFGDSVVLGGASLASKSNKLRPGASGSGEVLVLEALEDRWGARGRAPWRS